jgi:hypothetical protein
MLKVIRSNLNHLRDDPDHESEVYVSDKDYSFSDYVSINGVAVVYAKPIPSIESGQIAMNGIQIHRANVEIGKCYKVSRVDHETVMRLTELNEESSKNKNWLRKTNRRLIRLDNEKHAEEIGRSDEFLKKKMEMQRLLKEREKIADANKAIFKQLKC